MILRQNLWYNSFELMGALAFFPFEVPNHYSQHLLSLAEYSVLGLVIRSKYLWKQNNKWISYLDNFWKMLRKNW